MEYYNTIEEMQKLERYQLGNCKNWSNLDEKNNITYCLENLNYNMCLKMINNIKQVNKQIPGFKDIGFMFVIKEQITELFSKTTTNPKILKFWGTQDEWRNALGKDYPYELIEEHEIKELIKDFREWQTSWDKYKEHNQDNFHCQPKGKESFIKLLKSKYKISFC